MIVTRLMGGLGNQMFQYAAGRGLAHRHGVDLKLDLSWFAGQSLRRFELESFHLAAEPASAAELAAFPRWPANFVQARLARWRKRLFGPPRPGLYVEPHFHHAPEFFDLPDDTLLVGYWQSEKYFADVADLIREDFTLAALPDDRAMLAETIMQAPAVSVHVRRGDYASDPDVNRTHGVCGAEYFRTAVGTIAARVERLHAFVFSDDISWARANLEFGVPTTFIEPAPEGRAATDMHLMSWCRHHVIANSSFSWWGAWLNPRTDKIVVAPRRWFATEELDDRDVVPAAWLRM